MGDYSPIRSNGAVPFTALNSGTAAITGGMLVAVDGDGTVGVAGAGSAAVVGVAAHDAAQNARLTVWPINGVIHETVVSAAITAGNNLISAASGQINTAAAAAGTRLGVALTSQSTVGQKARWLGGL